MLTLFLTLWVAAFALSVLAVAAVPTTVAKTNDMLIQPAIWSGVFAAAVTLCVAGLINLFS